MAKETKASKLEYESRVVDLALRIASGVINRNHLLNVIREQDWNISERQADNYIRDARELIAGIKVVEIGEAKRKMIIQLDQLLTDNYLAGDFKECRQVLTQKAALLGLVDSRFAGKDAKIIGAPRLQVVSRFKDKWDKVAGGSK